MTAGILMDADIQKCSFGVGTSVKEYIDVIMRDLSIISGVQQHIYSGLITINNKKTQFHYITVVCRRLCLQWWVLIG